MANSCRNLVAGMAEWNGGYAHINDDNKLQIDKFSKAVSREYRSGDLMELDYSDETVTFSKVKTSQKNKTYEMGADAGYTLILNNQYIGYGLDDTAFETALEQIYNYYRGFSLTPMTFTLAEPDFDLRVGDRVQVFDEEEQVLIVGNVSKIVISGNCSMTVTCGGFDNISSHNNYTPTSYSQVQQASQGAKGDGKLHDVNGSAACAFLSKDPSSDITSITAEGSNGKEQLSLLWSEKLQYLGLSINKNGVSSCSVAIEPNSISLNDGSGNHIYIGTDHGDGSLRLNSNGAIITGNSVGFRFQAGNLILIFNSSGLFVNGKKVITEE